MAESGIGDVKSGWKSRVRTIFFTEQELPDTFSMRGAVMECPERLCGFLELLIRGKFGNIFRAKEKVRAGEQEGAEKVVFIGTEISRNRIRHWLLGQYGKIVGMGA